MRRSEPYPVHVSRSTSTTVMITKVAVAGGTAPQLGQAIVTAIQDYPDLLQAIVLTRPNSKIPQWLEKLEVEIRRVDYMSEDSLVDALEDVHTVNQPLACSFIS